MECVAQILLLTLIVCRKQELIHQVVPIRALKPRFLGLLRRQHPTRLFNASTLICTGCMYALLLDQVSCILEEDQDERIRFQESAIKTLGEFEHQETTWQKNFELERTFGDKAADLVARFGGSWKFLLTLIGFILSWCTLNMIVPVPWDPYPFILLNLFLSMMAGFQAPVRLFVYKKGRLTGRLS